MSKGQILASKAEYALLKFTNPFGEKIFEELNITKCAFYHVHSEGDGGAITLQEFRFTLSLDTTGFHDCTANSGGGVFFEGLQLKINGCCFLKCCAQLHDQAIRGNLRQIAKDYNYDNSLQNSVCTYCAPLEKKVPRRCVFLYGGLQNAQHNNFTQNHVIEESSALSAAFSSMLTLTYSCFANCSGSNLIWIHRGEQNFPIKKCNCIQNVADRNDPVLIQFENSHCDMVSWYFAQNYCPILVGAIASTITLEKCAFDFKEGQHFAQNSQKRIVQLRSCMFIDDHAPEIVLSHFDTWDCWAIGFPSPAATRIGDIARNSNGQKLTEFSLPMLLMIFIGAACLLTFIGNHYWGIFQSMDEKALADAVYD